MRGVAATLDASDDKTSCLSIQTSKAWCIWRDRIAGIDAANGKGTFA